jgi:hypothetical protein
VKPKHELLQAFIVAMHRHDLMKLHGEHDEYESEALSVLSRFSESVIHGCKDADTLKQISEGIVRQAFEFWFSETPPDVNELTSELLAMYLSSEQQTVFEASS